MGRSANILKIPYLLILSFFAHKKKMRQYFDELWIDFEENTGQTRAG